MTQLLTPTLIRLLLVLAATLAAHILIRHALKKASAIATQTDNIWDDALIAAARRPLPLLLWLGGIAFALHLVHRQTGEPMLEVLAPARDIGFVICIAWFLFKLIREVANNVIEAREKSGTPVDRTTLTAVSKVSRIAVLVIAALIIVQTLGFSVSGVLAFGGVGGIAVGFAAKDLLANFFGGLMIHLDRPFEVGETIRSPDKQIEGKVEHIGWRQTSIRATNMSVIYVPNSLFTSIIVENPSRMSHRRIREIVGLRYDDLDKVEAISHEVLTLLQSHPQIDQNRDIVVALDQLADSSLNLLIQALCTTTDSAPFQEIKQRILLDVAHIVARHGAELAFPTHTVYLNRASA